ncbi:MAG: CPBP family intramembrane glutamic endopeptidase [Anaerolineae bacterium]
MSPTVRRILIFIAVAFGIAYLIGLVIWLTGGIFDSPLVIDVPGVIQLRLSILLIAGVYMFSPAVANIVTRYVTQEGFDNLWLAFKLREGWPFWLIAWFGTPLLILVGAALFYAIFPDTFDPTFGVFRDLLEAQLAAASQSIDDLGISITALVLLQFAQGVFLGPVINALFVFGEEFGWRAYLQQRLLQVARPRLVMVLMGVIWGLWHAPIIAMGHNYGLVYPGYPWAGIAAMCWFTFVAGTFIAWLTIKGRSVWPAVIAHGSLNGVAGIVLLSTVGNPNPVIGPSVAGVPGSAGFALVTLLVMTLPGALEEPGEAAKPLPDRSSQPAHR